MLVEKDKVPKGVSFVLKSSTLENALLSAGISVETHLRLINSSRLFDAHFWPPNPNVGHERFYVYAGVVPSTEAHAAKQLVESQVVPQFISWANSILGLSQNSPIRREKQYFSPNISAYTPNYSLKRTAAGRLR